MEGIRGCRNGSVVRSAYCTSWQPPSGDSQPPVTPAPGNLLPSSVLCKLCIHIAYTQHRGRQAGRQTHANKIFRKKWGQALYRTSSIPGDISKGSVPPLGRRLQRPVCSAGVWQSSWCHGPCASTVTKPLCGLFHMSKRSPCHRGGKDEHGPLSQLGLRTYILNSPAQSSDLVRTWAGVLIPSLIPSTRQHLL